MLALGGKPDVAKGDRRFRFWTQSGMGSPKPQKSTGPSRGRPEPEVTRGSLVLYAGVVRYSLRTLQFESERPGLLREPADLRARRLASFQDNESVVHALARYGIVPARSVSSIS